ncbi:MAG: YicC family protein [Oscillospiraceae bacterium]|nr:YicC family protein [Oscillospiraceae bacterium]MBR4656734.1 YicC family protein [Oscillospiraceae bacterium]
MIKSMTGYGRAVGVFADKQITVELRSVNNRYLDCAVKLPRLYAFCEDAVKQAVKQSVSRGKVDVFVTVNLTQSSDVAIGLNRPVLEGYLAAMKAMADGYPVRDDISVSTLSRLPDVFTVEKAEQDENLLKEQLLSVVREALDGYNAMRAAEGEALAKDLIAKAELILEKVAFVEERSPKTVAEYREKLLAKMQELLASTDVDEARILTEAAIYADKVATDEETVRLRSHLDQLRTMLRSAEPIGRKLDFLMQEINRETNTIGSKCSDLEIARTVVDVKAELEKIREQIQNIE